MYDSKTVSSNMSLDLYIKQLEDVNDMRSCLLTFNRNDPNAAKKAIHNITVLRVYHQMSRIIRYTEMMNKIEDKLYQSLDSTLDNMDVHDADSWRTLMVMQERLQENMIQSHKLLEPYLNLESLSFMNIEPDEAIVDSEATIFDKDSRERLRNSAQEVLRALQQNDQTVEETIS